jgi:hypothetical protein
MFIELPWLICFSTTLVVGMISSTPLYFTAANGHFHIMRQNFYAEPARTEYTSMEWHSACSFLLSLGSTVGMDAWPGGGYLLLN